MAPAARREQLLAVTARLALEQGVDSLTARSVASAAGVAPGLVHHHFESIEELIAETFAQLAKADMLALRDAIEATDAPLDRLRLFLERFFDPAREPMHRIWLDAWGSTARYPTLNASVREQMQPWKTMLVKIVKDGVKAGALEVADPVPTAHLLLFLLDGTAVQLVTRDQPTREVRKLVTAAFERELGLPSGAIRG